MTRILVVDDEPYVREMIEDMLSTPETEILLAANGLEALNLLSKGEVSLVITDIVMPEENGIDLIMNIRNTYPNLPVIAISGGGGIEGRFDYLEIAKLVGANQILKKPFNAETLRKIVVESLK